jgi:microcystin-dependent protein/uncharacterized protein YaiE (UPF0345 family)
MADVRLRDLNPAVLDYDLTVAGSVGIGTTSPSSPLHISYAGGASNGLRVAGSSSRARIRVNDNDTSAYFIAEDSYVSIGGSDSLNSNNININTSNGRVGIGTASPAEELHVVSSSTGTIRLDGSAVQLEIQSQGTTRATIGTLTNHPLRFYTYNIERMTILGDGKIGIGTATPDSLLELSGADESQIKVTGASGAELVLRASASTVTVGSNTNHNLYLRTNNTARLTINGSSGEVGIGTTSPVTTLNIKGGGSANGQLYIEPTADGDYAGLVIKTTRGADREWAVFAGGTGTDDLNFRIRDETSNTDRLNIDSSGNVGIGTTSPTETLHVNGNLKVTGSVEVGASGFNVSTGFILAFGVAAPPSGWLACNGSAVSRTTYSALYALIGTTYGAGNGSSTFNVPDLRGRTLIGTDGLAAGSFTSNLGTLDNIGGIGGAQNHTLTTAQMPAHTHSQSEESRFVGGGGNSLWLGRGNGSRYSLKSKLPDITSTGGGESHNTVQPSLAISYLIKT